MSTRYGATILSDAGVEAAEGSIGSRLVSQALDAMAGELEAMLRDNRITAAEVRRQRRMVLALAKQARAAEEAADLEASASNKIGVAEQRLLLLASTNGDVKAALYLSSDRADHEAERAAGVLVLGDRRAKRSRASAGNPDSAA